MKRTISFVLALILCLVLVACGDETVTGGTTTAAQSTTKGDATTTTTVISSIDNQTTTVVYPTTSGKNEGDTTTTTTRKQSTTGRISLIDREHALTDRRTMGVNIYPVDKGDMNTIGWQQSRMITYKGTIVIGNTIPSTATGDQFNQGLKSYINTINYNGGLGGDYENGKQGYYIYFINYDDGGNETNAYNYTKDLIDVQLVYALVGMSDASATGATLDYIKQSGIIACYFSSASSELFNPDADTAAEGSRIFPVQPTSSAEGRIMVGRLVKKHPNTRKIGIVYTNDTLGKGIRDGATAQIEALGDGYEYVIYEIGSADEAQSAVERVSDCDAIILAADNGKTVGVLDAMIENGVYNPTFLPSDMASSRILTSVSSKYMALDAKNKFPIYCNTWMTNTDVDSYYEFCQSAIGYTGDYSLVASTPAIKGWMAAKIFCEGMQRILESGKKITDDNFVKAMESAPIALPMGESVAGEVLLDYSDGLRAGVTTMGLIKNSYDCTYFEETYDMNNFAKFLKTGDIDDIK